MKINNDAEQKSFNTKKIGVSRKIFALFAVAESSLKITLIVLLVGGLYIFNSISNRPLKNTLKQTSAAINYNTLTSPYCQSSAAADSRTPNRLFNVVDYGATGKGIANDTQKIQAAINAAKNAGGGTVWFPAGTYLIQYFASGTPFLTTYPNVTLKGYNATIFKAPSSGNNRMISSDVYATYPAESAPLIIKCMIIDGNLVNQGAYNNHQLEQAANVFLSAAQNSPGRLRVIIEDTIIMNSPGDGAHAYINTYVSLNRIFMKQIFRGGITTTGGNTRMDTTNYYYEGTSGHDSMDIEVDAVGYNGNKNLEFNLYNSDIERTVELGSWSNDPGESGTGTILRLDNVKQRQTGYAFGISAGKGMACFKNVEFRVPLVDGFYNSQMILHSKTTEFKDSTIYLDDELTNGSFGQAGLNVRWGFQDHPRYGTHLLKFDNVQFKKDPTASSAINYVAVFNQQRVASDVLAFVNSPIGTGISAYTKSNDGSSNTYLSSYPSVCNWNFPVIASAELQNIPRLNSMPSYPTSTPFSTVAATPAPTQVATPTLAPTPISTNIPASTAAIGPIYDDSNTSAFTFSPVTQVSNQESSSWVKYGPNLSGASANYQSGNHTTKKAGATASLSFNGTGFKLFGSNGFNYGKFGISIDGSTEIEVDTYVAGNTQKAQQLLYTSSTLPAGNHKAVVRVLGVKNANSQDTYIVLDKLEVIGENSLSAAPSPTPTPYIVAIGTPKPTIVTTSSGLKQTVTIAQAVPKEEINNAPALPVSKDTLIPLPESDKKVEKVEYFSGNVKLPSNQVEPYQVDSSLLKNGEHIIAQKITYKDGTSVEQQAKINVDNKQTPLVTPAIRYIRLHKTPFIIGSTFSLASIVSLGTAFAIRMKRHATLMHLKGF